MLKYYTQPLYVMYYTIVTLGTHSHYETSTLCIIYSVAMSLGNCMVLMHEQKGWDI